jgi:hypothetical protein
MRRSQVRWLLVVVGVSLWFVAILPAYYVVHKPLAVGQDLAPLVLSPSLQHVASAILNRITDLILLALTLIVAAAWGRRIQRWIGALSDSELETWALSATLGLGLLGTVVFMVGGAGGLYRWLGYALLLGLGLAATPEIRAMIISLTARVRGLWPPSKGLWLWLYIALIGLFALGMALLPPTGWDALVYHLQGPRLYLEAHRLVSVPESFYLNWPAQVEMLFTWGMLLKGDILAKLFHWVFWLLTAAMLYALTRRTASARAGRWAVALWASIPFATELAGLAYVDLGLTAFVLAAVTSFLHWTDSGNDRWLPISALFIGLAMATKYTAATWFGLLVLLFIYHAWQHQGRSYKRIVVRVVAFAFCAGLPLLPWLIKNWSVTGNPIYPFLFGGRGWNATRIAWLTWPGQSYSHNLLDYLALPWLATVLGTNGTTAFDATIGPLILCLAPLVFLFKRPRSVNYSLLLVGGQLLYFAATIYACLYLTEIRLLLPAFPFLCLTAAFALDRLPAWDRKILRLSRFVGGVVAIVLVTNLVTEAQSFLAQRPLAPLVGLESGEAYLARQLGIYFDTMQYISRHLPGEARLAFLSEPRGYYCQRSIQPDEALDNLAQLRATYASPDAALSALEAAGFTHLLFYRAGLEFLQAPAQRPPTLSGWIRGPSSEPSFYPISDSDLSFLEAILSRCSPTASLDGIYEIYQLP